MGYAKAEGAPALAPAQRPEDVREVVGPDVRRPGRFQGRQPRRSRIAGSRAITAHVDESQRRSAWASVTLSPSMPQGSRRSPARLPSTGSKSTKRFEMLNSSTPSGRRRSEVERQRLARQQVDGDGVGGERVDRDQAVLAAAGVRATAAVAELDVVAAGAVAQVGEQPGVARDVGHRRVDLVERPALAGSGVAGQRRPRRGRRSRRASRRRGPSPIARNSLTHRAGDVVVGQRPGAAGPMRSTPCTVVPSWIVW